MEAMYPVRDDRNLRLYEKYLRLAEGDERVRFGGRLGSFRYYDMDDAVAAALRDAADIAEGRW
jgi:UDP-galactopyranose mutase